MSRLPTAPLMTTLVVAVLSLMYLVVDWSSTVSMMVPLDSLYTAETLFGLQLPLTQLLQGLGVELNHN